MMIETISLRKNPRLQGYDYALAGGYFATVCASQRGSVFGAVADEEVVLNEIGQMVQRCWLEIPNRFPSVELDVWIMMPDHFHAILFLLDSTVGAGLDPAHSEQDQITAEERATSRVALTLGRVIGAFKSISTNRYFAGVNNQGWPLFEKKLWQRGYHDRIIRSEEELNKIRHYIFYNAVKQEPPDYLQ